jgi:ABC-type sugar transport system permease subunit
MRNLREDGPVRAGRLSLSEQGHAWWLLLPAGLLVLMFLVYPLGQTLVFSLFDLERTSTLSPDRFVGLGHYLHLLGERSFWRAFGFTTYFTVLAVVIELTAGLVLALVTLRIGGRWQGAARTLLILPWAIPPIVQAAIWKWLFNSEVGVIGWCLTALGVTSSPPQFLSEPWLAMHAVILVHAWRGVWIAAIFLLGGLAMMPPEVHAAASVDGATPWQRFWRITLPLLRPAIAAVLLLRCIDGIRAFEVVYGLTGGGPGDATEVLSSFAYRHYFSYLQYGRGSAYAMVTFLWVGLLGWLHVRVLARQLHGPGE